MYDADRLDAVHLLSGAVATGSGRVLPVLDVDVGDDAAAAVTNRLPLQEAAPFKLDHHDTVNTVIP